MISRSLTRLIISPPTQSDAVGTIIEVGGKLNQPIELPINGQPNDRHNSQFLMGPPPDFWKKQNKIADQLTVTEVTANDHTITILECKTPQGFFVERTEMKSIAVSTDAPVTI